MTPKDRRGWTQLLPGVYDDHEGGLHLDLAELLRANGYADSPDNRATLIAAARDQFKLTIELIED